ncbi:Chloroplastic import inner membrane translocase subunit TIM22-2 [Linum perenne]
MATTADSPKPDADLLHSNENPTSTPPSAPPSSAIIPSSPYVCLSGFATESACGAVMGSIFGFGSGLFRKKGFKGSLAEAGSHAKTFALLSGVHGLVVCFLRRLRGKDDVINAGVAGCCTGLALSFPAAPQALLQNCVMFGAFSFITEGLNKKQTALAHPLFGSTTSGNHRTPLSLDLPLSVPLPQELNEAFSFFRDSLRKLNHKRPGTWSA